MSRTPGRVRADRPDTHQYTTVLHWSQVTANYTILSGRLSA